MLRRGALEGPHTPFPSRPLLRTPYPMRPQTVHTKTSRPPRRLTAGLQPVEPRKKERHTRDLCPAGPKRSLFPPGMSLLKRKWLEHPKEDALFSWRKIYNWSDDLQRETWDFKI